MSNTPMEFNTNLKHDKHLSPDYPSNTVPNKVEHLFMAQLFHDRRQREARLRMTPEQRSKTPAVDYLRPIIAVCYLFF